MKKVCLNIIVLNKKPIRLRHFNKSGCFDVYQEIRIKICLQARCGFCLTRLYFKNAFSYAFSI